MDMNKLTQKSQEALASAQSLAVQHGHQEVDFDHLALALITQENGLIGRLLSKREINPNVFSDMPVYLLVLQI